MSNDTLIQLENQDIFDIWNDLTKTELMIYVALRELGDVTQAEIARYLDVTERKVRRAVKLLKSANVVTVSKQGRKNDYFFAPIQERKQEQSSEQKPELPSYNNNDKILTKEIPIQIFNDLLELGIKDLPQTSKFSRRITKNRTPKTWLMSHDSDGTIAGRVSAWAEFKRSGGLIDVNPILLWLNILQGESPPEPNAELAEMQAECNSNLTATSQDDPETPESSHDSGESAAITPMIPSPAEHAENDEKTGLWDEVLALLECSTTQAIYDGHLKHSRLVETANGYAIEHDNERSQQWINSRLKPLIDKKLSAVLGESVSIVARGENC